MFQRCKSNEKERETSMGDPPGFLLHSILETLVSDLFHRLSKIEGNQDYLITIHQSEIEPLVEMFQLCKSNEKERETSMGDSPGFLLHSILEALVRDLFHRLSKIEGNLEDLEDEIFDE